MDRNRLYITILLPVLLLIPLICICMREKSDSYIISHYFGSDEDAEKYVRTLSDEKIFDKVFMNDTPGIEVVATKKQAKKWVEKKKADIEKCMKEIDLDNGYRISFNEDYTVMTVSASPDRNMQTLSQDLFLMLYNAEMIQIFSGRQDWAVEIVIINTDTGNTIYDIVYPKEDIDIADTLWDE